MSLPHRAIPHASHHTPRRNRLATSLIVLGVVAATGVALAGPANLMRELRARFESPRGARIERIRPVVQSQAALLAQAAAARRRLTGNVSSPQLSEIPMNLTYVDTSRTPYARFRTWVDNAVNGSPGYAYEARDSALMFRITRDVKYCNHAVTLVEQQVAQAETAIAA